MDILESLLRTVFLMCELVVEVMMTSIKVSPYGYKMCRRLCDFPTCIPHYDDIQLSCKATFTQLPKGDVKFVVLSALHVVDSRRSLHKTQTNLDTSSTSTADISSKSSPVKGGTVYSPGVFFTFLEAICVFRYNRKTKQYICFKRIKSHRTSLVYSKSEHILFIATRKDIYAFGTISVRIQARIFAIDIALDDSMKILFAASDHKIQFSVMKCHYNGKGFKIIKKMTDSVQTIVVDSKNRLVYVSSIYQIDSFSYEGLNTVTYVTKPNMRAMSLDLGGSWLYYTTKQRIQRFSLKHPQRNRNAKPWSVTVSGRIWDMVYYDGKMYVTFKALNSNVCVVDVATKKQELLTSLPGSSAMTVFVV